MSTTRQILLMATIAIGAILPTLSEAQLERNAGAVFVMTNSATSNEIIAFKRDSNGSLQPGKRFRTGGRGSGGVTDPLGSQGSLTLSQDRQSIYFRAGPNIIVAVQTRTLDQYCLQRKGTCWKNMSYECQAYD